jgi:hypothetical protein
MRKYFSSQIFLKIFKITRDNILFTQSKYYNINSYGLLAKYFGTLARLLSSMASSLILSG